MGNSDQQLLLLLPRAVDCPADYTIRLVKCLPGPMYLGFLAALQNRFQHLPPSLPMCTHLHKKAWCMLAVQGTGKWELWVQALFSWSWSWSPGMSPASVLSLRGSRLWKWTVSWKLTLRLFQNEWGRHAATPLIRNGWICICEGVNLTLISWSDIRTELIASK